jgi:hypothetical protein
MMSTEESDTEGFPNKAVATKGDIKKRTSPKNLIIFVTLYILLTKKRSPDNASTNIVMNE